MRTKTPLLLMTIFVVCTLALAGCQSTPPPAATAAPAPTATAAVQSSPTPPAVAVAPTATATIGPTATTTATPLPPTATASPTPAPPTATPTRVPATPAPIGEVSYDQVITASNLPPQTIKTYVKQGKMRLEMTVQGSDLVWITNGDDKTAYMYLPAQNTAIRMSLQQFVDQQATTSPGAAELSQNAAQGVFTGSKTVDGKECDVYELKRQDSTVRTCIGWENGFPLQAEVETSQGTISSVFQNVAFDGVPDSLFELPAGVQVTDFTARPALPTPGR